MPASRSRRRRTITLRAANPGRRRHLQPVCLALLAAGPASGYDLLRSLRTHPLFENAPPDVPGVYRSLQLLARHGFVRSNILPPLHGPARRVFRLAPAGRQALADWIARLRAEKTDLDRTVRLLAAAGASRRRARCKAALVRRGRPGRSI